MTLLNDVCYCRNNSCNEEDDYHRVLHLVKEAFDERFFFCLGKLVFTVFSESFFCFDRGQTLGGRLNIAENSGQIG